MSEGWINRHRVGVIESQLRDSGSRDSQERATESENQEVLEKLSEAKLREIEEIRSALVRIRDGRYFVCSRCEGKISPNRLEALSRDGLRPRRG